MADHGLLSWASGDRPPHTEMLSRKGQSQPGCTLHWVGPSKAACMMLPCQAPTPGWVTIVSVNRTASAQVRRGPCCASLPREMKTASDFCPSTFCQVWEQKAPILESHSLGVEEAHLCQVTVGTGPASWKQNAPLGLDTGAQPWQEPAAGENKDTTWRPGASRQQAQAVLPVSPKDPRPAQASCPPRALAPGNPGSGAVGQSGSPLGPTPGRLQVAG